VFELTSDLQSYGQMKKSNNIFASIIMRKRSGCGESCLMTSTALFATLILESDMLIESDILSDSMNIVMSGETMSIDIDTWDALKSSSVLESSKARSLTAKIDRSGVFQITHRVQSSEILKGSKEILATPVPPESGIIGPSRLKQSCAFDNTKLGPSISLALHSEFDRSGMDKSDWMPESAVITASLEIAGSEIGISLGLNSQRMTESFDFDESRIICTGSLYETHIIFASGQLRLSGQSISHVALESNVIEYSGSVEPTWLLVWSALISESECLDPTFGTKESGELVSMPSAGSVSLNPSWFSKSSLHGISWLLMDSSRIDATRHAIATLNLATSDIGLTRECNASDMFRASGGAQSAHAEDGMQRGIAAERSLPASFAAIAILLLSAVALILFLVKRRRKDQLTADQTRCEIESNEMDLGEGDSENDRSELTDSDLEGFAHTLKSDFETRSSDNIFFALDGDELC
jgi:hypothetical protein